MTVSEKVEIRFRCPPLIHLNLKFAWIRVKLSDLWPIRYQNLRHVTGNIIQTVLNLESKIWNQGNWHWFWLKKDNSVKFNVHLLLDTFVSFPAIFNRFMGNGATYINGPWVLLAEYWKHRSRCTVTLNSIMWRPNVKCLASKAAALFPSQRGPVSISAATLSISFRSEASRPAAKKIRRILWRLAIMKMYILYT